MVISAQCHCGNVRITADALPEYLGDCNCSICRRYKALWGYYSPVSVSVETGDGGTVSYIWGDRQVDFRRCRNCGCITHYVTTELCPTRVVAINFRMVEPALFKNVRIKKIDGASY
jgi:hypothetical protein